MTFNAICHEFESVLREWSGAATGAYTAYPRGRQPFGVSALVLVREPEGKALYEVAARDADLCPELVGETRTSPRLVTKRLPLDAATGQALRRLFPWTAPVSLRSRRTTLGCGDRLGRATAGHIRAVRRFAVAPVLAQQSMRELNLTGRTYPQVVDDVTFLVFQEAYADGFGADGDHLKTIRDIDTALAAGMTMITLDLSEVMLAAAQNWPAAAVESAFGQLDAAAREAVLAEYAGRTFAVGRESVALAPLEAKRCAVMYLKALGFADEVYRHLAARRGAEFDLELSVDETTAPTLPAHHFFISRELQKRGVAVTSLAPRFIGEFQKAIDYVGDRGQFEEQFRVHVAIAEACGGYKISVHSGSDKFGVFPAIGRLTDRRVHVKTAGTSWLEAVRTVAQVDPTLYRALHAKALAAFPDALRFYHVTPDLARVPNPATLADGDLPGLMDQNDARQLLHVTYGSLLNDPALRGPFFALLHRHEDAYSACLERHFEKHLRALGVPPRES